jgi:hypothetical protein
VPSEYWEYKLVDTHFRGNWLVYWEMPEPDLWMIQKFMEVEAEIRDLSQKRSKHGR